MRPRRPLRRARRHRAHRRPRRRTADRRRDRRPDRPVPRLGSGVPADPEGDRVGVGAAALVDRRPTPPRRRHPRAARPTHRTSPAARSPTATVDGALAAAGLGRRSSGTRSRTLCGPGGAVRAVLAPAGYGKTAMAHVAAGCAAVDGRPVVAVATTAKAVAELDAAGPAGAHDRRVPPRPPTRRTRSPGTVVVLDEISQTSTRDAHTVLAAVADCPGGQLWILGDPHQAPAVKAGGIAAEIAARADAGLMPAAELTVNRRPSRPGRPPRGPHPALRRRLRPAAAPRARVGAHRRHPGGHPAGDGRRGHR